MGGRGAEFRPEKAKGKIVDKVDLKNDSMINSYCKQTLDYLSTVQNREECVMITKNGEVWHFKGDKFSVRIPQKFANRIKIDMHNHPPYAKGSFSKLDMQSWKPGETYLLTDGEYDYKAMIKQSYIYDPNVFIYSQQYGYENNLTNEEEQHLMCLYLKSKGMIEYERLERHT